MDSRDHARVVFLRLTRSLHGHLLPEEWIQELDVEFVDAVRGVAATVVDHHLQKVVEDEKAVHVEGLDVLQLHEQLEEDATHSQTLVVEKGPDPVDAWEQFSVRHAILQHLHEALRKKPSQVIRANSTRALPPVRRREDAA